MPGAVYPGKVETVLQAISSGQTQVSGAAVAPRAFAAEPFVVRIRLDDQALARRLPAGAMGTAAIYTDHVRFAHFIRRVLLRQIAILNYFRCFTISGAWARVVSPGVRARTASGPASP